MSLTASESTLFRWAALGELSTALAQGVVRLEAQGLWGSSRALVVAALVRDTGRPLLYLSPGTAERHRAAEDVRFFRDTLDSSSVPVLEFPPAEPSAWHGRHRDHVAERALVCHALVTGGAAVVVTTPAALGAPILSPETFRARTFTLTVGATFERDRLLRALETGGYERVDTVVEVGQWSLRGGIVDIFSPAHERPARAEFFGDEIESLRLFDPTTQRSVETLGEVTVLPLAGADHTLPAWLPSETLIVLDDPALLEAPPEDAPSAVPLAQALAGFSRLELPLLQRGAGLVPRVAMGTRSVGGFQGRFKDLAAEIRSWRAEGFAVRLVVDDEAQAARCRGILQEHDLEPWPGATLWSGEGLGVITGDVAGGFHLPALGLVLLAEEDIFGARRRRLRRPVFQRGAAIAAFTDLNPGDLVVHEAHGIGRYHGLRTMSVDGRDADFLLLEYAEGGRLYLPVERLDLISKYMGAPSVAARLDRMGGGAWQRVKESVRAAVRQMAEQLLRLYAARSVAERRIFSGDTPWQREFEAAFRFEETRDQLRAIEDTKRDMEGPRPMDRLVAGDVGYGKTEVALRAAFKAVADGRQVAVLVPTTVLAQQHFHTFSDRFSPFPTRVELLSRFRSPREQKAVVAGLKTGAVDVVIGTHRLLSKDVAFRDLGLLVVDEEHRFGVTHKERIKQLRTSVDVLTLTATPIPRTLYMSLAGARDLSVIETPPLDRLPVETIVTGFDRKVIKEAIERELQRGGQVFFVHNRIQSLPSMTTFVRQLCPQARVVMGHGQMGERELEAVMVKFVDGEADVLVSTAIVESGLDIPASNTIIINRADRFGLAQLYQLRGRVGRERQQAFAYLLVPAAGSLDETAQRRLRVIEEMTELGAGFQLAMRDLEIRGAGNLLGAEQHGHIAAVGFDLYTKLLAEAVRELKGEPAPASVDPVITVEVEALLPDGYVPEVNQRLAIYQRLADVEGDDEIAQLRAELADRFGPPPPAVVALLDVVGLRVLSRRFGVERLEAGGGRALLTFAPSTPVAPERILTVLERRGSGVTMRKEFMLEAVVPPGPWDAVRDALRSLLESLA
ncbi:MAG TPA: transcription-repair coupling factor [Methylomirabilota bacterium]|jgi:transcription-repair coupling factor (superfamily II helicase)|nr:transcription-repair coupling factor [Methylomirabilota bacterium]